MRVSPDEFVGQLPGHGLKIKGLSFARQLGVEKDVEENVPQFLLEGVVVSLVDSLEQFVDLLEDHGAEGAVGLLAIPRATPRSPQAGHDAGEGFGCAHPSPLRGGPRFVEPERDGASLLVMIIS